MAPNAKFPADCLGGNHEDREPASLALEPITAESIAQRTGRKRLTALKKGSHGRRRACVLSKAIRNAKNVRSSLGGCMEEAEKGLRWRHAA